MTNLLSSILSVNLEDKLIAANRKALSHDNAELAHQANLDAQIEKLRLGAEAVVQSERVDAMKVLGFEYKHAQAQVIKRTNEATAHLPQDRVFTTDAIKKLCCTYGLRFLPTALYKGELDAAIPERLADFRGLNRGKMPTAVKTTTIRGNGWSGVSSRHDTFFIAAPEKSFVLTARPKDPLLFAYLGGERWYLIHKWGSDLSVGARIKNWVSRTSVIATIISLWLAAVIVLPIAVRGDGFGVFMATFFIPLVSFLPVFAYCDINSVDPLAWLTGHHVNKGNWNSAFTD